MAKLVLDDEAGTEFELATLTTIGRQADNTILVRNHTVSKKHAKITRRDDGEFEIQDLASSNGTQQNGKRIEKAVLYHEDRLMLGEVRFSFVDPRQADRPRRRITITPSIANSAIRQRSHTLPDGAFPRVTEISDDETLRSTYEHLRVAFDIGQVLSAAPDEDILLESLLDEVFARVAVTHGLILLVDEKSGELTPKYTKCRDGYSERFVLLGGALAQVESEKTTVLVDSETLAVCVPILDETTLLGILHARFAETAEEVGDGPVDALGAAATAAGVYLATLQATRRLQTAANRRTLLRRFLPRRSAESLMRDEKAIKAMGGGELRDVTVLCVQITGFDDMDRTRPGRQSLVLLNKYLNAIIEVLFASQGTLERVGGDQVVALFGAPIAQEDAATRAVDTALEIGRVVSEQVDPEANRPVLRIGITTGPALVGFVGSSHTRQYSAFGRTATFASELCRHAEPGEIRIDGNTRGRLPQRLQADAPSTAHGAEGRAFVVRGD